MKTGVDFAVLSREDLPRDGNTYEFVGAHHQNTEISFIWVDLPPGGKIRLHKHPYKELFIIQDGIATFTVGPTIMEAHAGQIIIVPADIPHKFMNASDKQLRQIDIHFHPQFITYWLEE